MTRRLLAFDVSSSLETELAVTRTVSTVAGPAPSSARTARRPREWEIWARLREIEGDSSRNAWHFIFCHARGVRAIGVSVSRTAQAAAGPPSSATVRTTRAAHARRDWGEIGGDCEMIHQMLTLNVSSPPAIELAVSHSTSAAAIRVHRAPLPTRAGDWGEIA